MFVITGNASGFKYIHESKQVFIDGGMYAQNFLMGLHLSKVGCCFKMVSSKFLPGCV